MNIYHRILQASSILISSLLITACNLQIDSNAGTVTDNNTNTPDTNKSVTAQVGTRPLFLIDQMQDSALKNKLAQCRDKSFYRTDFSIGHRGASLQYPEHTKEAYQAAIDAGAGVVECDVTFTSDKELVCRHSQCDLATTTNILAIPELANKCTTQFTPADPANGIAASAKCCTSDITLNEFKSLCGKMDGANTQGTTVDEFMAGTPSWRTDLNATCGTLMTHQESIAMFKEAGVKMTPELKSASVQMPFDGMSQEDYAQKMLDEYVAAGVPASDVYPQSFNLADVQYWIANASDFAKQAVYLDDRYDTLAGFDPSNATTWSPTMAELKNQGVEIVAPPLWVLVTLDADKNIVPSAYAIAAKSAGLKIITWSLERSGPLNNGGGWYFQSITDAIDNDGDTFELVDVLAKQVGVMGIFSDWPATVTYYANCMDM